MFLSTKQNKKLEIPPLRTCQVIKAQLPKIIQSGGFLGKTLGNMMGNLSKIALIDLDVTLAKDVLPKLAKMQRTY